MSAAAGVICLAKPGDRIERGQPLLELRGDTRSRFASARDALAGAIEIGPRPPGARRSWSGSETLAPPEPDNS